MTLVAMTTVTVVALCLSLYNSLSLTLSLSCPTLPPQVESPWTIRKLSGTLCWLEVRRAVSLKCFGVTRWCSRVKIPCPQG